MKATRSSSSSGRAAELHLAAVAPRRELEPRERVDRDRVRGDAGDLAERDLWPARLEAAADARIQPGNVVAADGPAIANVIVRCAAAIRPGDRRRGRNSSASGFGGHAGGPCRVDAGNGRLDPRDVFGRRRSAGVAVEHGDANRCESRESVSSMKSTASWRRAASKSAVRFLRPSPVELAVDVARLRDQEIRARIAADHDEAMPL